ncbi:HD-GYP domain-containing protein [Bacillus salitolerans]|uniref:HD-GYP domain-containing protein n=1 Tax=Bacillus salitolerans TaxID=1437434 RepID=A0ABW4LRD3_9BACI
MRLVATQYIEAGTKLHKAIFNEKGQILVNKGIPLTKRMIERLEELGITYVYIEDERTNDVELKSPISDEVRREAVQSIEHTFRELNQKNMMTNSIVLEQSSKKFNDIIRNIILELKDNKDLLSLLTDVVVHDHYIFTHSLNVTLYSLAIGIEMKLPEKQLEVIGLGAILHDVGKMMVSLDVLLKPERLTADEFNEVKKHTTYGYDLLRKLSTIPLMAAHCAFQHHERLDGSGYPRGIKSDEIHIFGKIIAVADVFDAVTSNRVYRKAMLPNEGLEILYAGAGHHFDSKIIEAFRNSVAIYPIGITVTLNNGLSGVVVKQNSGYCDRPFIRILENDGVELQEPYEVNLKDRLDLVIVECILADKKSNSA